MKYVPQQWDDNCFFVIEQRPDGSSHHTSRLITTQTQYATRPECQAECDRLNNTVIEWMSAVLKVTEGNSGLFQVTLKLSEEVVQQFEVLMSHAKQAINLSRFAFANLSFDLPLGAEEAVEKDWDNGGFIKVRLASCYIRFTGDDTFFISGWTEKDETFSTQLAVLADFKAVAK